MKIQVAAVLIVLIGFCSWGRTEIVINRPGTVIEAVYLVDNESYHGTVKPTKLPVGIDMTKDVYYKIIYKEKIIKGGQLQQGINHVDFWVDGLLEESACHHYILAVKPLNATSIFQKEIRLHIERSAADDEPKATAGEEEASAGKTFRLSMFVKDKLVAAKRKWPRIRLSSKARLEPSEIAYGPYNPVNGRYPVIDQSSFSLLPLARLALRAIKRMNPPKKKINRCSSIQTAFFIEEGEAIREKINLTIRIETINKKSP